MINRTLKIPLNHSAFIFGPRQTGKTYLIKETLRPHLMIDLLTHDNFFRYGKNPGLLQNEVKALRSSQPLVVVDEIQRCPELLNEVQSLMEGEQRPRFILTGSSARKLKRKGSNLLAGRAITLRLHPFTHEELGDLFSLEESLRFGNLPKISLESNHDDKRRLLRSYVETYLNEEIQQEALTRNIVSFSKFLDLAAFENGRIVNFSNLSREIGVDAKTIRGYFQILEDTLIGFFLPPYVKSTRAKLVKHAKFFFFDCGVANALQKTLSQEFVPGSPPFGHAFEQWLILETRRILDYREREHSCAFFRTADGAEVDLILAIADKTWAVEIKSGTAPGPAELSGLKRFLKDHNVERALCVCRAPRRYADQNIEFLPWQEFLKEL
ncbi:MAG: ATP-binding protein [Elusimicrobia bacterium]|nr:ATP-binding protein [Elusimicrobiota bacterium]